MQYYKLEQETDICSLNTGRVIKTIWMNNEDYDFQIYEEMSFVIIDSKHLTDIWVKNLASKLKKLFIITTNKNHPAFLVQKELKNIEILFYENKIDFKDMMEKLKNKYKIEKITIQSWWTLNKILFENNLIHKISIVVAPVIIWWKYTPTLVDWEAITSLDEINKLKVLKLTWIDKLENSYLYLKYDVEEETEISDWFEVPN